MSANTFSGRSRPGSDTKVDWPPRSSLRTTSTRPSRSSHSVVPFPNGSRRGRGQLDQGMPSGRLAAAEVAAVRLEREWAPVHGELDATQVLVEPVDLAPARERQRVVDEHVGHEPAQRHRDREGPVAANGHDRHPERDLQLTREPHPAPGLELGLDLLDRAEAQHHVGAERAHVRARRPKAPRTPCRTARPGNRGRPRGRSCRASRRRSPRATGRWRGRRSPRRGGSPAGASGAREPGGPLSQVCSSPTISAGTPQIAREACIPDITAASTQPASRPVFTQSPARNRFS